MGALWGLWQEKRDVLFGVLVGSPFSAIVRKAEGAGAHQAARVQERRAEAISAQSRPTSAGNRAGSTSPPRMVRTVAPTMMITNPQEARGVRPRLMRKRPGRIKPSAPAHSA